MVIALLFARVLLVGVFMVAGLAKLADRAGSQQSLRDFGIPALLASPLGVLLPLAELAVAVALLLTVSAWWGAVGALALLLVFIAGMSLNLAAGRTPDCHCFGQLHSAPVGWPTLMRNLGLAIIAGFIVALGRTNVGEDVFAWFGDLTLALRLELFATTTVAVLLAVVSWMLLQVLGQQGRFLLRLEVLEAKLATTSMAAPPTSGGLSVGTLAPTFALSDLDGQMHTLDALRASSKPILLLFSDAGCGPCTELLPEIGRWQRDYADKITLALLSRGARETNRAKAAEHAITHVLLQQDREVARAYQAYGTPSAVLVRPDGTIGSTLAQGADAIRALVAEAVGLPVLRSLSMAAPARGNGQGAVTALSQRVGPKVGEQAPELRLPDLTGKMLTLADCQGSTTLVLFWNPGCGFCQQMLADLKAWESRPPTQAPKLLVVSRGTLEANKAMGLRSPVVLDQDFTAGPRFSAEGTPMAILIDAQGKIASEVVAGAPAVFALAGAGKKSVPLAIS